MNNLCAHCGHLYQHHRRDDSCPLNWNEDHPRTKFAPKLNEQGEAAFALCTHFYSAPPYKEYYNFNCDGTETKYYKEIHDHGTTS
jgi:hypothetical protein